MIKIKLKRFIDFLITKFKKSKFCNKHNLFDISLKFIYLIIFIIILVNVISYSYKAWLYPIRLSQYFDECSYISMGKYFRTIPPVKIFTEHILKNKDLPKLYNEFDCRLVYWPVILSFPLQFSEDRIELHKFRAVLMTIGTILFFLIGFKLGGITGGVISSAFWIGTPLLNYWGHFFMSENPSFIFLIAGFLCLLYSERFTLSSFFGGIFLGIAFLIRFTTMPLIFAAPFFIIATYFSPFKRKTFQILGELSKTFAGFIFAVLPFFIFTWWLFKNPFFPFTAARTAVNSQLVHDSLYYARNLWYEGGLFFQVGFILSFISPLIISFVWVIRKIIIDKKNKLKNIDLMIKEKKKTLKIIKILKKIFEPVKHIKNFIGGILYYVIIIISLMICTSIYIYYITSVPHKLPRYLMGAIIPIIIISSIGFGFIELFITNIFRFIGHAFLSNFNFKNFKFKLKQFILICSWLVSFIVCIFLLSQVPANIWKKTMNRPFNTRYIVQENVLKDLKEKNEIVSILRLQPENISWKNSINDRLKKVLENPENGIDTSDYYGKFNKNIVTYLNNKLKKDEVFYVDRFNYTPYTPAYTEVPCIHIESNYSNSINTLIKKGELLYKGYVLISNDPEEDTTIYNEKTYIRSLNKNSIISSNKFKFIKRFGPLSLYYYYKGKPFPYKFGTKKRIARLYKNSDENNSEKDKVKEKDILQILQKFLSPWQLLFKK